MALKSVIDKLEDVEEGVRSHYKQESDGKFYLETDKGSVRGLLDAKAHEKNLRVAAEQKLEEKDAAIAALTTERDTAVTERDAAKSKQGSDVQALEASWQQKLTDAQTAHASERDELNNELTRLLVSSVATQLAAEISTVPELLAPVIEARLQVEKGADGKRFTRVLDGEKKPSAATLDELKQELLANEKYAGILIAGKGSGGGAGGSGSGGSAEDKRTFTEFSDAELVTMRTTDPDRYKRLRDAANQPAI